MTSHNRTLARFPLRALAAVWLALLVAGSLQPARPGAIRGFHRPIHWIAFAGAALMLLALSRTRAAEAAAIASTFLLGVSLEVLQHFIYGHPMEWRDIADDGLAVAAACALFYILRRPKVQPELPVVM